MSSQAPLIIKLVASCTRIIRQAGKIIQEVYEDGNLKIVEKVKIFIFSLELINFTYQNKIEDF